MKIGDIHLFQSVGDGPADARGPVGDEGDPAVEILWCVHGAGERRSVASAR